MNAKLHSNAGLSSDYLHNGCTRAEAIRNAQLHDISRIEAALNWHFTAPAAITPGLWRTAFGNIPFALDHPLLRQLCRHIVAHLAAGKVERTRAGWFSETSWVRVQLCAQELVVKVVCHPGDDAEAVITLLGSDEATSFEN